MLSAHLTASTTLPNFTSVPSPNQLDHPAFKLGHSRVENRPAVQLQRRERPRLVGAHHARIADHVGGEDRRKPAIGVRLNHPRFLLPCRRSRQWIAERLTSFRPARPRGARTPALRTRGYSSCLNPFGDHFLQAPKLPVVNAEGRRKHGQRPSVRGNSGQFEYAAPPIPLVILEAGGLPAKAAGV
jgi:hypothetical protein